jgi:hypothetical protein
MSIRLHSITVIDDNTFQLSSAGDSDHVAVVVHVDELSTRPEPDVFSWGGMRLTRDETGEVLLARPISKGNPGEVGGAVRPQLRAPSPTPGVHRRSGADDRLRPSLVRQLPARHPCGAVTLKVRSDARKPERTLIRRS